ncbi:hypothetical protein [Arthrobacter sp. A5]|uniref:hypothetical protein n=1 Tax=Arthrobacter sp. A5 TaxID=576926 RepID=UPI003DA9A3FC
MTAARFYVYFVRGAAGLDDAAVTLPDHDLYAAHKDAGLEVRSGKLIFTVTLDETDGMGTAATEAGKDSEFENDMSLCTARFDVEINDLETALDEIHAITELQAALQDCSGGFIFLPWNDGIIEPWVADDDL